MKHTITLIALLLAPLAALHAAEPSNAALPDVRSWRTATYDEAFFQGRSVCGEKALTFWMQSVAWRSDPERKQDKATQFERLLTGDAQQVAKVNKEIQDACRRVLADVDAWRKKNPHSRTPSFWIIMALRAPDKLTAETHAVIRETLKALDLGGKECGYIGWMRVNGSNGANVHGYLTPLVLAPALIDDPKVRAAGEQALLAELAHMNRTGDMSEFNLLESHWNGTASWEVLTRYIPDPQLRRMARLIRERLWINRFLTWSPAVARNTGPGSRMAPSEWLGCDGERALFATGLTRPIWVNFFFAWDGWDSRAFRIGWPLAQTEAFVPDLPSYLHDLAWHKSLPNELQCRVELRPEEAYRNNFKLEGIDQPTGKQRTKYVNYQGRGYTLGSTTWSWVVATCVVNASAWWNNSRNPRAPLGSPERFCVLYPHYVINGMSFLDKGDIYYEEDGGKPLADHKGGPRGPWMREFVEFGRVGTLQDRNTLLMTYAGRPGMHQARFVKDKVQRASAAMFLFRWTDGTDGLFVNREPVRSLPRELAPGDWWFIEDGDVYAAIRPLEATRLRGGKTMLEKRTRHVVLYQDNVAAENISGIDDADWIKARNGFVVEMGDKAEFGSFAAFQGKILAGKVTADEADGFTRHIAYERDDRRLDVRWHAYTEEYATRKINGRDDPWTQFAQSPEFAVSDSGQLAVEDAKLSTTPGKTTWLLSCAPSRTWVAYQPNADAALPLTLDCPAGRVTCERLPLGKLVIATQPDGSLRLDADAESAEITVNTKATKVEARINGKPMQATHAENGQWTICSLEITP